MSDPLVDAVNALQKSSGKLNQIMDTAAETVRQVEEFLNNYCSVGIHAWVKVWSNEAGGGQYLEYRRVASRYRIAIVWANDMNPENETIKPWSDASRDDKLETVVKLPDLITAIAVKLEEKIVEAEKTSHALNHLLTVLTGKGE